MLLLANDYSEGKEIMWLFYFFGFLMAYLLLLWVCTFICLMVNLIVFEGVILLDLNPMVRCSWMSGLVPINYGR